MVDTDGLLDRCSYCGARAAFVKNVTWDIECSECANIVQTGKHLKALAMVEWNKAQRKARSKTAGSCAK